MDMVAILSNFHDHLNKLRLNMESGFDWPSGFSLSRRRLKSVEEGRTT